MYLKVKSNVLRGREQIIEYVLASYSTLPVASDFVF